MTTTDVSTSSTLPSAVSNNKSRKGERLGWRKARISVFSGKRGSERGVVPGTE